MTLNGDSIESPSKGVYLFVMANDSSDSVVSADSDKVFAGTNQAHGVIATFMESCATALWTAASTSRSGKRCETNSRNG
jgi:hypothetical protein